MCMVSQIGDDFQRRTQQDEFWKKFVFTPPVIPTTSPQDFPPISTGITVDLTGISRHEFEMLKREVEHLKKLLERAVQYDKDTNQPHCETDAKIAMIKEVCKAFGIDLKELLEK